MSKNAVRIAADLVLALCTLEDPPVPQTDDVRRAIDMGRATMDHVLGEGADRILERITVSVGVINGGVKINVLPGHCRLGVDIRLPIGLTHAGVITEVEKFAARYPEAKLTPVWTHSADPSASDPSHPMIGILQSTVENLGRPRPAPVVSLSATDCKHWRHRGVLAYVYGCTPTTWQSRMNGLA